MEQILEALRKNVGIVGVFGMGGIGGTMIMEAIASQPGLFATVVMCTVFPNPDIWKIQREIAGKLDFKLDEGDDEAVRAWKLRQRIKQEREIVIILDDLWERLDLATVGIPVGHHHRGGRGCKVVITTREEKVCNEMRCDEKVRFGTLSDADSWKLFKENAFETGDPGAAGEELSELGQQLVNECGGLPLAITVLGRALRDKDAEFWEAALIKLRRSDASNIPGVEEQVFKCIELSFRNLQREDERLCFLFCCLFSQDIGMEDLVRYAVGEGFLRDSVEKLSEAEEQVRTILEKLKDRCLLESFGADGVVRGVATHIASSDAEYGFLAEFGTSSTQWPERANRKDYKRISLMRSQISVLPEQCESSKLLTLLLSGNEGLRSVPDQFIQSMEHLLVLDLRWTGICSLPPSLDRLKSLRTLLLYCCKKLADVSMIGELEKLEILDLSWTSIRMLPRKIELLSNLRYLELKGCELDTVPPNVISKLTRLEHLGMWGSFHNWEMEGRGDGSQAALSELFSIPLNVLILVLRDPSCISVELPDPSNSFKTLTEFRLFIGQMLIRSSRFCTCVGEFSGAHSLADLLLSRAVEVEVLGVWDVNISELGIFKELKFLEVDSSKEEFLIGGPDKDPFPCLERLKLRRNSSLTEICRGPPPSQFLNMLKTLEAFWCDKLVTLLPSALLSNAGNLEHVSVCQCDRLRYLFQYEHNDVHEDERLLSKLRTLEILDCDKLEAVVVAASVVADEGVMQDEERTRNASFFQWPMLEKLTVSNCTNLKNLPSTVLLSAPNLKEININSHPRSNSKNRRWVQYHLHKLQNLKVAKIVNIHQEQPHLQTGQLF